MKKLTASALCVICSLVVFSGGFVAGQIFEAKQHSKFDLQFARHMYKYAEKDNMPGLVGLVETMLVGKSQTLQSALDSPLMFYVSEMSRRRIASDDDIRELISEVGRMEGQFTNRMTIAEDAVVDE